MGQVQPLMVEKSISDDIEMLVNEIQAVDTAPGDIGQTLSSFHSEHLQDCDKLKKHCLRKELNLV